ncbi:MULTISPECIES: CheR family methyltransferase [unclassified Moorena]|uniref:CheR family methyltransferase n=1 Tax=unclassified Moorena TaxID=2683338 RepID=UPI0013C23638|nr:MULTISPECIES: CheR family methyltransferase [unclassified Moorena]NEP33259.1 chemotaxis protein CheR [Moorena sp. SIO3B2]NET67898.1 chemotaxis protein CheR [Moorena sp. SIO1G6]
MIQATIEALLRKKIGLDGSTIGSRQIARAIETRRLACGLPDQQTYLQQLQTSPQELEALIETVVVLETWFFRDRKPFAFLSRYVISEWLPKPNHPILRVLSIPCSTGEEPYSIAMTLLDAGLTPNQFRVDAIDINKEALRKARRALYSRNSFRGNQLQQRKRYFKQTADGYELCQLVRNTVNFKHGNILEPLGKPQSNYDIIFCRNLLIYLDKSARFRAIELLDRLLMPKGLLFVGSAETGVITTNRFVSVRYPFAFAYQKVKHLGEGQTRDSQQGRRRNWETSSSLPTHKSPVTLIHSLYPIQEKHKGQNQEDQTTSSSPSALVNRQSKAIKQSCLQRELEKGQESLLEKARRLANQGSLEQAATLCQTYLSQNLTSAEAYVLLGEVHQGLGNDEQAEQCFQKAVYLKPNSYEALFHLALLQENRGELAKATVIRQRIKRLQNLKS